MLFDPDDANAAISGPAVKFNGRRCRYGESLEAKPPPQLMDNFCALVADGYRHLSLVVCIHNSSNTPAAPIPVPIHMVTMPHFCLSRFMPWRRVAVNLAPVAPSG